MNLNLIVYFKQLFAQSQSLALDIYHIWNYIVLNQWNPASGQSFVAAAETKIFSRILKSKIWISKETKSEDRNLFKS